MIVLCVLGWVLALSAGFVLGAEVVSFAGTGKYHIIAAGDDVILAGAGERNHLGAKHETGAKRQHKAEDAENDHGATPSHRP